MNGLILYVPGDVDPVAVTRLVAGTHRIQLPSRKDSRAMVVREGAANVWIDPIDESELTAAESLLARTRLGSFRCIGLLSSDFAAIAGVLRPVLATWPCLVDDDQGHIVDGRILAEWLEGHPLPTWDVIYAGAIRALPVAGLK